MLWCTNIERLLPLSARKQILKRVGRAIEDSHSKDWIHLGMKPFAVHCLCLSRPANGSIYVKPNNVMLDYSVDETVGFTVQKVVLGDLDCALKLENGRWFNGMIGNFMWRSIEGQIGKGIRKPSEVFSFGLLVS